MIPGMNPRQMQQMMKKMGMQQQDIPATEVIIKTADKEIVITSPSVQKVNMMGQETYQISGEAHEREKVEEIEFSADDIKQVIEQTGCTEEEAKTALKKTGDLAEAILSLSNE